MPCSIKYITVIIVLFIANTVYAEIYKWVDERGKVHYSQTPPNNSAEIVIIKNNQPSASPSTQSNLSAAEKEKRYLDFLRQERIDREVTKAEENEKQAEVQARCNSTLANYNDIEAGGRFYELDAQGERIYLSDQQLEKTKNELKQFLDKSCPNY